jgi:hypothetical protein
VNDDDDDGRRPRRLVAGLILGPADPHVRMEASLRLFSHGVDVTWIGPNDAALAQRFDALMVFGDPADQQIEAGVPLVRQFWNAHKSLAFFGRNETLLSAAQLVSPEAPGELQGVVSDPQGPSDGALDEFIDALSAQPHNER